MERIEKLIHDSNVDLGKAAANGGVGFLVSLGAMTINDWAALIVAILTAIYMLLQIEAAWQRRREAKERGSYLKREGNNE